MMTMTMRVIAMGTMPSSPLTGNRDKWSQAFSRNQNRFFHRFSYEQQSSQCPQLSVIFKTDSP